MYNKLEESWRRELSIRSVRHTWAGEEVFNTYGEPSNADLLHMYGFIERDEDANANDCVEMGVECMREALRIQMGDEKRVDERVRVLQSRWTSGPTAFLMQLRRGIVNDEETLHALQVFTMSGDEFEEFVTNDCEEHARRRRQKLYGRIFATTKTATTKSIRANNNISKKKKNNGEETDYDEYGVYDRILFSFFIFYFYYTCTQF